MFTQPRMVTLRVPDLARAREWYCTVLGREPVLDAPFAVVFPAGECALMLLPAGGAGCSGESAVAFFTVEDIEAAQRRLLDAGAAPRSEVTYAMLEWRIARVVDPFGNVLGIMSAAESARPVETRPSESAMTVAFSRALAWNDDREGLRGPDHLAAVFLDEEGRKAVADAAARSWLLRKMAGTHEYFLARTRYLDGIVLDALEQEVPQVVLLGAGYDTRSYRFRDKIARTRIFELDVEVTQARKRRMLDEAGVQAPPQLTCVTADFEKEALGNVLARAGFDTGKRTLFLCEGVTYYLSVDAVDQTLESVRQLAPRGSTLCFDYLIQAPGMADRYGVKEVFDAWRAAYSGEPVRFGIDEGTIGAFLSKRGYELVEHLGPEEMEQRFLLRGDGSLAGRVVALFSLVQARVSG